MSVVFNAATAANVSILRTTNELFQVAQKRVATGKKIFSAADEATRFTMSSTMLSRSKNLDSVNANISTALKTLESTEKTLTNMRALLQQMNEMANRALNAGSTPTIATATTSNIGETTSVSNASTGHRLSITSDSGQNFTYTFAGAAGTTTWGQVAQALNNANIGVTMRFETSGTGNRIVLESTDKVTGFTIDGSSSSQVVANIGTGLTSGYDGSYNASRFVNGTSTPTAIGGSNPYGLRFGTGGMVMTASAFAASSVAAGSSITFLGNDGVARTWATTTAKNLDSVVSEINAMNAGVKAEIVQSATGQYRMSLRNLSGNTMTVLNGTGAFDSSAGLSRFNATANQPVVQGNPILGATNNDIRLKEGANYEAYKTELTSLIANNVTQAGRNLLRGENVSIILNEFSANAITVAGINTSVTGNLSLTTNGATWTSNGNISTAQAEVKAAMTLIDSISSSFGTYASFVKDRYEINRNFSTELKSLGDDLVAADVAEESAKLTALQTQQQFAVQAFSAGSQNAQALLRLLG